MCLFHQCRFMSNGVRMQEPTEDRGITVRMCKASRNATTRGAMMLRLQGTASDEANGAKTARIQWLQQLVLTSRI